MKKFFTPKGSAKQHFSKLFSPFALLFLGLFFASPSQVEAQCFNSFQFRAPVTLNYAGNDTLTDFQVKFSFDSQALIAAGNMRSDAADLRFTGGDCCTPLCYYIEGGVNTANTVVWVKVDQIMGGANNLVMVYGDSSATDASDADCTFEFWDDFNDNNFDLAKWEVRGNPQTLTEAGGNLTLGGSSNWDYVRTRTSWTVPVSVNYRYSANNVSTGLVLGYTGSDNRYTFRASGGNVGVTHDNNVSGGNSWLNQSYPGVPFPTNIFYDYTVVPEINGNNINVLSFCNTTTSNCNTTPTALTTYTGSSYFVGFSSYSNTYIGTYDFIWVTKYSPNAITATVGTPVNVPPRALAGVDSLAYCSGSSFTLDAGAGFSSYVWSNGDTSQTTSPQMGGLYSVLTTDGLGCTSNDSVIVSALAAPVPAIAQGDTSTCGAATINFNTQQSWSSYIWSNGDTTQSTSVTAAGTYSVEVTDANGCTGNDTVTYTVLAPPAPQITGDTSACEGTAITLDAGSGFSSYDWSTTDQTQTTDVTTSGSYTVTVTDANGCTGTDTYAVSFLANAAATITTNGDTLISSSAATYQWMLNGNAINGATDSTYVPFANGAYSVMVTYANGCSNTSDTTSVLIGLDDVLRGSVSIFPNPTRNSLQVGMEILQAGEISIRLFDLKGKLLIDNTEFASQGAFSKAFDLKDLAEGMYLMQIDVAGQRISRRIVKQ